MKDECHADAFVNNHSPANEDILLIVYGVENKHHNMSLEVMVVVGSCMHMVEVAVVMVVVRNCIHMEQVVTVMVKVCRCRRLTMVEVGICIGVVEEVMVKVAVVSLMTYSGMRRVLVMVLAVTCSSIGVGGVGDL